MNERDAAALREVVRLCGAGANLVVRGHQWYLDDPDKVPGLAAESLIIKMVVDLPTISRHIHSLEAE